MIDSLAAVVGLATGLFGCLKALSDLVASRVRQVPSLPVDSRLLAITTTPEDEPSQPDVRLYLRTGWFVGVLGVVYLAYGAAVIWGRVDRGASQAVERSVGAILAVEGAFFLYRALLRLGLRGRDPGSTVNEVVATATLQADLATATHDCLRAMLALGAIRARGCHLVTGDETSSLQGGTGAWPVQYRGQRIRIRITTAAPGAQRVSVSSVSFWPAVSARRSNERNVRHLVELLAG